MEETHFSDDENYKQLLNSFKDLSARYEKLKEETDLNQLIKELKAELSECRMDLDMLRVMNREGIRAKSELAEARKSIERLRIVLASERAKGRALAEAAKHVIEAGAVCDEVASYHEAALSGLCMALAAYEEQGEPE